MGIFNNVKLNQGNVAAAKFRLPEGAHMVGEYKREYEESIYHPERFWGKAAKEIFWYRPYAKVLDDSRKPFYRWFTGGELNTCFRITGEIVQKVRDQIGTFARLKQAVIVKRLPKTRSGKILRGTMKKIVDGKKYNVPSTIDDPTILNEIEVAVEMTRDEKKR